MTATLHRHRHRRRGDLTPYRTDPEYREAMGKAAVTSVGIALAVLLLAVVAARLMNHVPEPLPQIPPVYFR